MPRLGSASIIGSNRPRTRPTAIRPSRSSSAFTPKRRSRRLAAEGLHDQGGVEALVRDLGDLGAQLLGALHPRAHHLPVDDVDGEDRREDHQAHHREQRIGEDQGDDGDRDHDQRAAGERQRGDEEPARLDVGVRVRQQLTGGVPLVPGQRQPEVLAGDAAAVVGQQPVAHDPGEQAPAEDADDLEDGDDEDRGGREGQGCRGGSLVADLREVEKFAAHP